MKARRCRLRALDQVRYPVEEGEIGLVAGGDGVVTADAVVRGRGHDAEAEIHRSS